MPRLFLSLLLSLGIASSGSAVTMDWTPIGDPGNPADTQVMTDGTTGYGSVPYAYAIGTYEVTNAQYAEFLNAVAVSDPHLLYSQLMWSPFPAWGGITQIGSDGSYSYTVIPGRENMPVNNVSYFDAIRFANWLHNGQGNADTETGPYTLQVGNNSFVGRNPGATIVLPNEDEWYKAAYYDAITTGYFDYPAGSDAVTLCALPTSAPNRANCDQAVNFVGETTVVGDYSGSLSPYGTFDQGGNVREWIEAIAPSQSLGRGIMRGGSMFESAGTLAASSRPGYFLVDENPDLGFRLVMIPEPSTGLLVIGGLLGLAGWRRRRA